MVEKIINSVDAVLMRECLERDINPEGPDAPESLNEALIDFFNITDGSLASINSKQRGSLADNIRIVATGSKKNPCYSIIDKGEGQTPNKIPETFLSLTASNKVRIPFVQGKFNMGGTGSLLFCGDQHLQLIVSKRSPNIVQNEGNDGSSDLWGFTVVRREEPTENMKSSTYKYLAPDNEILTINSKTLPLLTGDFPNAYDKPLEWGTFLKLYEYQLQPSGLKSLINFDLLYRLSLLLPNIALPVRLEETRDYKGQNMYTILSGLSVRLDDNRANNIEEGFPSSDILNINGQEMKAHIHVFKRKAKVENYKKKEGIIFTINGQSHGYISKQFFNRKSVGMSYLSDSIFMIIDCTNLSGGAREKLFMNSRDRLRDGALKKEIEKELEKIIKNHPGLRELKERRRQEEIGEKIKDSKPLADILENVIKKSATLSQLLVKGERITDPHNYTKVGTKDSFEGKEYPTFFKLNKKNTEKRPKHCPQNQRFRIQFETDADNDYFTRDSHPGEFKLKLADEDFDYSNINLWNGIATLNCEIPPEKELGDIIEFTAEINDVSRIEPFLIPFFVKVDPPMTSKTQGSGQRQKPPGQKGNKRDQPSGLNLPNIIQVEKNDWDERGFDKETALVIKGTDEEGYDFYVNIDNIYLETEVKARTKDDPKILKSQYQYGLVLMGLSLLNSLEETPDDNGKSVFDYIKEITSAISPILLPMITSLGELENV
ncbi:MAG: hypothetical protein B655_2274 [Methanobacterium sp. Maddingley MBC34]|nr:MAG: hypothetical protein B655_2274 [Methanobacterium sp. Maddingley MBC34]